MRFKTELTAIPFLFSAAWAIAYTSVPLSVSIPTGFVAGAVVSATAWALTETRGPYECPDVPKHVSPSEMFQTIGQTQNATVVYSVQSDGTQTWIYNRRQASDIPNGLQSHYAQANHTIFQLAPSKK